MTTSTASLEINLRPIRLGFLVDPLDRRTLSEVARITTCQWGDIACPMIPIMDALPPAWCEANLANPDPNELTRGLLSYFEPDLLVETCAGQLDRIDPHASNRYERHPNLGHGVFVQVEGAVNTMRDVGVTMDHVYAYLHQKEFQFERRRAANRAKGQSPGVSWPDRKKPDPVCRKTLRQSPTPRPAKRSVGS